MQSVQTITHCTPPMSTIASKARSLALESGATRSWFTTYARSSILAYLRRSVKVGALEIVEVDGKSHFFGQKTKARPPVKLTIIDDAVWTRVLIAGDLGFSEAYMSGDVVATDLSAVFNVFLDNEASLAGLSSLIGWVSASLASLQEAFLGHTFSQNLKAIAAAYDQSNDLYKAFLSPEMMYSVARWSDEEGGVRGDLDGFDKPEHLAAAQRRKIHHTLRSARVKPGHRLLEFGSGWGAMAITAARDFGAEVDTLTLSKEQKALAEERIREAGLEGRVRVHLMDYRNLPAEWKHTFDAFVSCEMIEHVGTKYWPTYFKKLDWALKPDSATAVITATTRPEYRYVTYQHEDFARRYMWPGTTLPSATALPNAAYAATQGRFTLSDIENLTAHYPRTLRAWSRNMDAHLTPEVLGHQALPKTDAREANFNYDAMVRKWQYMFWYAAAGYARGYATIHQWTFTRGNNTPEPCA